MKYKINPSEYFILVCDDEESIRSIVGEALEGWGFQVATAPHGEAALEFIKAGNLPHIVLTDIRMGGITGIELSAKVKEISPEIEVIIMTSHGTFETAVQAMRIGVFDYLAKPFENIDDVRTTIVHVCERIYLRLYTEYLMGELENKNKEIQSLAVMSSELAQNLDLNKAIEIGCQGLSRGFGDSPVVFFQFVPSEKSLVATLRHPIQFLGEAQPKTFVPVDNVQDNEALLKYFRALKKDTTFMDFLKQAEKMNPKDIKISGNTWNFSELVTRGIPRGVFAMSTKQPIEGKEAEGLLSRYVQTIGTAFENALLHSKVVATSIRDGLTGLFNVRHFKERFATELGAHQRIQHPMSLVFFDVDHFKKYNDTHGHPAGDQVLKLMAEQMRKNFRGSDILARYGGEEFCVLMPHTAFSDALDKAEKFRVSVEKAPFPNEQTQPLGKVTISIGVSEFPTHGATVETVIKAADDALYEGKKKSRNVVVPGIPAPGYISPFKSKIIRSTTRGENPQVEAQADKKAPKKISLKEI